MWPHEVEPWFHSWYRGRVETLDAKYNLIPLLVATPVVQREQSNINVSLSWDTSSLSLDPPSSSMLDQSFDSLKLEEPQDLLEHYQLNALSPTELHVSALYGTYVCMYICNI